MLLMLLVLVRRLLGGGCGRPVLGRRKGVPVGRALPVLLLRRGVVVRLGCSLGWGVVRSTEEWGGDGDGVRVVDPQGAPYVERIGSAIKKCHLIMTLLSHIAMGDAVFIRVPEVLDITSADHTTPSPALRFTLRLTSLHCPCNGSPCCC